MVILKNSSQKLGDGNNVSIRSNKWLHNRICDVIDIEKTSISLVQYIVADFIKDGECDLPDIMQDKIL